MKVIKQIISWIWSHRRKIILWGSIASAIGIATLTALYVLLIMIYPGDHLKEENILKSISVESPVYYRDGKTRLGVFFQQEHRQYVPFDKAPKNFINALVAAEDSFFFRHPGFNPLSIARAMVANAIHLRVVQGGSTLTQQTAKNIFARRDRSIHT